MTTLIRWRTMEGRQTWTAYSGKFGKFRFMPFDPQVFIVGIEVSRYHVPDTFGMGITRMYGKWGAHCMRIRWDKTFLPTTRESVISLSLGRYSLCFTLKGWERDRERGFTPSQIISIEYR